MKWPTPVQEWSMRTFDIILQDHGVRLPYLNDLVKGCIQHNTILSLKKDIIIPDLLLEFCADDPGKANPIYPVICQTAFSQNFQSVQSELKILAQELPSLCMAVVIDIVEKPSYQCPQPKSLAHKMLSKEPLMTSSAFYKHRSTCTGLSPEHIMVYGHTWGSLADVEYHVWVKPPGSDHLCIDAKVGENYASCVSFAQLYLFVVGTDTNYASIHMIMLVKRKSKLCFSGA